MTKIPINNNNTYISNFNNINYTNFNTSFSTLNVDNSMINKSENVNSINNINNYQNNYTINNLRNGSVFFNNNFNNRYKIEKPNYNNNYLNKKSSDLSEYAKYNDYIGMDNCETSWKPTNIDVFKLLNSYNSNNLNDNNDQNNYLNYNGFQSGKISNIFDEKKSLQYIPTPLIEKKFSFPAFKNSESFEFPKGPALYEPQFSQSGFKRCTSNLSL
jgi:hypothetical protein